MWTTVIRIALIIVDGFVALSAIGGGIALAVGLENSRFSTDILRGTPFKSFLIPGFMLAVIVGGSAAVATLATVRSADEGAVVSIVAGVVMSGWIIGEVLLLNQPSWSWTEAFYFAAGLAMVALGLDSYGSEIHTICLRSIRAIRPLRL